MNLFFINLRKLTNFQGNEAVFIDEWNSFLTKYPSNLPSLDTTLQSATPSLKPDIGLGYLTLSTGSFSLQKLELMLLFVQKDDLKSLLNMSDLDINILSSEPDVQVGNIETEIINTYNSYIINQFYNYFEISSNVQDINVTFDHFKYLIILRLGFGNINLASSRLSQMFDNFRLVSGLEGLFVQIDLTSTNTFEDKIKSLYNALLVGTGVFIANYQLRFKPSENACFLTCNNELPYDSSLYNPLSIDYVAQSINYSPILCIQLAQDVPAIYNAFEMETGLIPGFDLLDVLGNNYTISKFIENTGISLGAYPYKIYYCYTVPPVDNINNRFIHHEIVDNLNNETKYIEYINLAKANKDDNPAPNDAMDTLPICVKREFSLLLSLADLNFTQNVDPFYNIPITDLPDPFDMFCQNLRYCCKFMSSGLVLLTDSNASKFVNVPYMPSLFTVLIIDNLGWDRPLNLGFLFINSNGYSIGEIENALLTVDEAFLKTVLQMSVDDIQKLKQKNQCLPQLKEQTILNTYNQFKNNPKFQSFDINFSDSNIDTVEKFKTLMVQRLGENSELLATYRLKQIFQNIGIKTTGFLASITQKESFNDQCVSMYEGLRKMVGVYYLNTKYRCKPLSLVCNQVCGDILPIDSNSDVIEKNIILSPYHTILLAQQDTNINNNFQTEIGKAPTLSLLNTSFNNVNISIFAKKYNLNLFDYPLPDSTIENDFRMNNTSVDMIKESSYVNLGVLNGADTINAVDEFDIVPTIITRKFSWLLLLADIATTNNIDIFENIDPIPPPPIIPDIIDPISDNIFNIIIWVILTIFVVLLLTISVTYRLLQNY